MVCIISIILNMILSVCPFSFDELFIVFALIKHTIFAVLFCHMVLKYLSQSYIIFLVSSVHSHLGIKSVWSRKLNSGHKLIYLALIKSIESIYNIFAITRCTYASINYNGVTLRHNLHKVHCRGTYKLVRHNHQCFPIFYPMMLSIFFVFEQWNQTLDLCISSGSILCAIIR